MTLDPPTSFELERRELEAVLSSELLARAPALSRMLRFVCEKYFAGQAEEIREYTVAVEALGRPRDFNPKRDPIVRVEAHRLRKRLAEYYAGEGAGHQLRLVLEPGQYVPRFEWREGVAPEQAAASPAVETPAPAAASHPPGPWGGPLPWVLAGVCVAAAIIALWPRADGWGARPKAPPPSVSTENEIRILAGVLAGSTVDPEGAFWDHDEFFRGGEAVPRAAGAFGFTEPARFWAQRVGAFDYDIPLGHGSYELRLFFGQPVFSPARMGGFSGDFAVKANGKTLMDGLTMPLSPCKPGAPAERVFSGLRAASDGKLHLRFERGAGPAWVDAIELKPEPDGKPLPIRMEARSQPYIDAAGRRWAADRYFCGGTLVPRWDAVSGSGVDTNLFSGERWGTFSYAIPAAAGRYRMVLRFAEFWFGLNRPGGGGAGSRVFDIFLNGRPLERNLDVYARSGGSLRALLLTYDNVSPGPTGEFFLQFLPQKNNAMLNAIELDRMP